MEGVPTPLTFGFLILKSGALPSAINVPELTYLMFWDNSLLPFEYTLLHAIKNMRETYVLEEYIPTQDMKEFS